MPRFSKAQLDALRREYSGIQRVDPDGAGYKGLVSMLDRLPCQELRQISKAKIKFVSSLALNRVSRKCRA